MPFPNLKTGGLLRVTCIAGLLLLFLVGGTAVALRVFGGKSAAVRDESFYRLLRDYDRFAERAGQETGNLDRELDKLEQKAEGTENWLSVLKRRRQLARIDPRYAAACRQSARRAREAYPYSEPLAAIASAVIIRDAAINRETAAELRSCLSLLAEARYDPLRLSLHALLGDLQSPGAALDALPPGISAAGLGASFSPAETAAIAADLAIVRLLRGDSAAAAAAIQGLLAAASPPPETLRFAAEYLYDFGDLPRAAELFSRLPGDEALLRQADALWLAGYSGSARAIWSILAAAANGETADDASIAVSARSLYNLALTAASRTAAAAPLERLIALPPAAGSADPGRRYGRIRYSRLLDAPRAIALLEANGRRAGSGGTETGTSAGALLDLEILRRRTELAGAGRLIAETWLLLGRYPETEQLYRWAAWFFDYQRNYTETAALLKTAARHQFSGQWAAFHGALQLLREGNLDAAESAFAAIPVAAGDWAAAANRGRIFEARSAPARALEWYETAAAALMEPSAGTGEPGDWDQAETLRRRETASRIQFRIAACLKTLGRPVDSRRVLEYALDLNPDNHNARLELGRLGN